MASLPSDLRDAGSSTAASLLGDPLVRPAPPRARKRALETRAPVRARSGDPPAQPRLRGRKQTKKKSRRRHCLTVRLTVDMVDFWAGLRQQDSSLSSTGTGLVSLKVKIKNLITSSLIWKVSEVKWPPWALSLTQHFHPRKATAATSRQRESLMSGGQVETSPPV